MNTEKTTTEKLASCVASIIVFFLYPWFLMKGWNVVGMEFNLPPFDYWTCLFFAQGVRYLFGGKR